MAGWLKLHRDLKDKAIWKNSTPEQKAILISILMEVNYLPSEWEWKGEKFIVQPGQTIKSLQTIADLAGVTIQNVRTAIARFEKYEFLTNESTKTGRLITIVNWGLYQGEGEPPNKPTNKEPTKSQQRPNKDLTTIEERKKEENNTISSCLKFPLGNSDENVSNDKRFYDANNKYYKAAFWLSKQVYENTPRKMKPVTEAQLQNWANTFRLMEERDRISQDDIGEVLVWAVNHDFWKTVILSAGSFRDKYNQLVLQMSRPPKSKNNELAIGRYEGYADITDIINEEALGSG